MKSILRFIAFFLILLFFSPESKSQCIADAGSDTLLCVTFGLDTFYLGGSPTVLGGTAPYSYTWEANYVISSSFKFTASDFLDDTTAANPLIINFIPSDTVTFYLTVTDSAGNSCKDSILLDYCRFTISFIDPTKHINQGDTIALSPGIGVGCPPLKYFWSPNYNISDSTATHPLIWPDTTTFYEFTVVDSANCEMSSGYIRIYVNPVALDKHDLQNEIEIYPNPLSESSSLKVSNPGSGNLRIMFFDVFGNKVKELNLDNSLSIIEAGEISSGIYFYKVFQNERLEKQARLIVH